MKKKEVVETFEYNGMQFQRIERHNDDCRGCYFWEEDVPCTPSEIPLCGTGIYIRIDNNDSKRTD